MDILCRVGTQVTQIDLPTPMETPELRKELTLMSARLAPVADPRPVRAELLVIREKLEAAAATLDPQGFARLNAVSYEAMLELTGKELTGKRPFRGVARRLPCMTARLWVHASAQLDRAGEIAHFRRGTRSRWCCRAVTWRPWDTCAGCIWPQARNGSGRTAPMRRYPKAERGARYQCSVPRAPLGTPVRLSVTQPP